MRGTVASPEGIAPTPVVGYSKNGEQVAAGRPPTSGGMARVAIQGTLEEAPLPDVIQLLSMGRKTGCLTLTEREMQGEICLDRGRVCHAAVFSRRDRLGDMLVRRGRITQQQLDSAIAQQRAGGKRVSQTLLESGQLEQSELEQFVRRQVEDAVYFMFTWRTGTFAFTSSVRAKHQDVPVSIDPEGLLLEGARRVDEWSLIEKKVPSLDLVFRLDRAHLDAAQATLTPEQEQLVPLIDGSRDVNGLIEVTGLEEFSVGKALFGLITAGFATRVERRASMRHLDYRELLAYVVREAEFTDPEKRRAAARHIADCATCTQRLKTIHVRRTGTIPTFSGLPESHPSHDDADEPPEGPTATATLARGGDARRAEDRRQGERRTVQSAEWERPGRDRRTGGDRRAEGRRVAERRAPHIGDRQRAADALAARAVGVPQRSRPNERRSTGPRRIRPVGGGAAAPKRDTGGRIRPQPVAEPPAPTVERPATSDQAEPDTAAASAALEPTVQVTPQKPPRARPARPDPEVPEPPAEAIVEVAPVSSPPAAADAQPAAAPPAAAEPDPQPEPPRASARTTDIEWLVSPAEADHLLRTSRVGLAGPAAARPAAAEPAQAPRDVNRAPAPARAPAPQPAPAVAQAEAAGLPGTGMGRWVGMASAIAVLAVAAWIVRPFLGLGSPDPLSSVAPVSMPAAVETPSEAPTETVSQAGGETILPATNPAAEPAPPPERPVRRPPAPPATETRVAQAPVRETAAAAAAQPTPAPVPAVGVIRGVVRDPQTGAALAGVRITIPGTPFTATTDASGRFALLDVPAGRVALAAAGDGRLPGSREVVLETGATAQVDITLAAPAPAGAEPAPAAAPPAARPTVAPAARTTDDELAAGGWTVSEASTAAAQLRDRLATIPELWIESIATSQSGSRARARVALLTASGERIVLTQTRSGAPAVGGAPRVTALRIIPASEAYPLTTGTASFGSLLVTAKTTLAGDTLRALLATLAPLE